MPNWCTNELEVSGPAEDLKSFTEAAYETKHVDEHKNWAGSVIPAHIEETELSFRKLRPMPEELEGIGSGSAMLPDGTVTLSFRTLPDGTNEAVSAEEMAQLKEKFGATNWYEWNHANWGTKWDACEARRNDDAQEGETCASYMFDTAWCPPEAMIHFLAAKWPTLAFTLTFYEEGCAFGGAMEWADGELVGEEDAGDNLRDWLAKKGLRTDVKVGCPKCKKMVYEDEFYDEVCNECESVPAETTPEGAPNDA